MPAVRFGIAWCLGLAWAAWPPAASVRAADHAPAPPEVLEEAYVPSLDSIHATTAFESFDPDILLAQKVQDPAIETVDEMTRRGSSSGSSGGGKAGQWWDSIRDPAIRTVDEQTHGATKEAEKKWFDRINIRGYTQFRINSVLWNDESQAPPYHPADKSLGPFNEFFIRRCRIIFSGDLSDRLYFYIQPDFASGVPGARDGAINYAQLRDCYGDVYLTKNKVNRVRVGLSKVPSTAPTRSTAPSTASAGWVSSTTGRRRTPRTCTRRCSTKASRARATTASSASASTTARAYPGPTPTATCTS
jgi:hypothetical protein